MVKGGFEGLRLHRRSCIVPILIVVIRSVIQIGVIVRIVGIPINRPGKLLKKDTMVTETTVTKAAVISATKKSTSRKSPRPAESRTKATAGESAKGVTTPASVTTTTDKSVSSTSPAKSVTAASVSKGSRGHHRWNAGQDQTGKETFD